MNDAIIEQNSELRTQNSDIRLFDQQCLQLHSDCQNIFNKPGHETTTKTKGLPLVQEPP